MTAHSSPPRWVLLSALALVAFNLRSVLTSISPEILSIQGDTHWSDVTMGTLTMLPVLLMGVFALAVPAIAAHLGRRRTVWLAMLVLTVAMAMRLAALVPGVLHLSVLLGGIGNYISGSLTRRPPAEQVED